MKNSVLIALVCVALACAAVLDRRAAHARPEVSTYSTRDCTAKPGATEALFCTGKLPVNEATVDDLMRIRGIGPARARAIVIHRNTHGPFGSTRDLQRVDGIGPATALELDKVLEFR